VSSRSSSRDPLDIMTTALVKPAKVVAVRRRAPLTSDSSDDDEEYICGSSVWTWRAWARRERRKPPVYLLAQDMRSDLHDAVNNMDSYFRQTPQLRQVFEAAIADCTRREEPGAPPITVENKEDADPCPNWEFLYTNQMWHGEGVPPPDRTNLASCSCVGKCDPTKCSCAGKLRPYAQGAQQSMYNGKGCIDVTSTAYGMNIFLLPVFECNAFCGCDDDCPNRVSRYTSTVKLGRLILNFLVRSYRMAGSTRSR
jgi:histone-lysine N-methyltransferase SUV39H